MHSALKVFSEKFQVFINIEQGSQDGIGIVTLVKRGFHISDLIIGQNGRIIGLKILNLQIWNIYPKSGSAFKKDREIFFRESLCSLFMNWKDSTEFIIQVGDHNCIHRNLDSLNNAPQHLQPGLIKHMQINSLTDDFLNVHGNDAIMYSRITQIYKTRIDYLLSNTSKCSYFQYIDMGLSLDHCAIFARYDIGLNFKKEYIPKDRFFSGWVISKQLEFDDIFLENCKVIFEKMRNEFDYGENLSKDPSFIWLKMKTAIIGVAREREKQLKFLENQKSEVLRGFYFSVLNDLQHGIDCLAELDDIKYDMDQFYKEKSKLKVDKIRSIEIDDPVYDIHKLQNQRKYENSKKIQQIKIGDDIFTGTSNVVSAIEEKMTRELSSYNGQSFDAEPSVLENFFLSKLPRIVLTSEEKESLLCPTKEEEVFCILELEVDKDSSPGEDGITYRFISVFWEFSDFRFLYLSFLNFTRNDGSMGLIENFGVMTIKNKKNQSDLYEKKRKLTKVNKESNLHGKVWTNRFKQIIIPKVLPETQFNCQANVNIVDELRQIRSVNDFLMGSSGIQVDGTMLSIDFQDAFRSISHRWFNLVLLHLGVPNEFIHWFWMMYKDLYVVIVLNKYKSDKIYVERGFMEGHPPSMAAFVVSLIPMMLVLEEKLKGLTTPDNKIHKYKMFADDLKLFLHDVEELNVAYDVICNFENVSGLVMHRDVTRDKCQALSFGSHRNFDNWPEWISVKDKVKIVGGLFSNSESFEKINSELVSKCFYDALHKAYGIRGTIFQKAFYVNSYLFSKLWFTAQFCKLDEKMLKKLLSKALAFIYAGENERPVNSVNFRNTSEGGLGLVHPVIKAKALLLKNMYKELRYVGGNIYDLDLIDNLYGYRVEFIDIIENGLSTSPAKSIYEYLVQTITHNNGSLIPSRNEKRSTNIKWGVVFKNFKLLKGLNSEEKCFVWKICQDMLPVGNRIHRRNAERKCLGVLDNGNICQEIQTLEHAFKSCRGVCGVYEFILQTLNTFLGQNISYDVLIHFGFNHRSKIKLKCALWFATKMLYNIFHRKLFNKIQCLRECLKTLDWNLRMQRKIGSVSVMMELRGILRSQDIGEAIGQNSPG